MKKLFVILLAVALTLSLATVASAATFSPYVGGEFQLTYYSNGGDDPFLSGNGRQSMMKAYVAGDVSDEDTNTWARIGAKMTCWGVGGWDLLYSAGVRKVGGIVDIQYSTDDYETTLRGLTPIWRDVTAKFGGDPYFTNRLSNAFGFDVNTDNVTVNFGVDANGAQRKMVAAGTFKFDAGNVYVGYASLGTDNTQMIVGGQFKAGDALTINANYVNGSAAFISGMRAGATEAGGAFQATVSLDEMKLAATLMYDMKYRYAKDSTLGVNVEYSGIDKFTVGGSWIADDNLMEVYGIYKYGIFDIRPGYAKEGNADGYFYLALHAGLW